LWCSGGAWPGDRSRIPRGAFGCLLAGTVPVQWIARFQLAEPHVRARNSVIPRGLHTGLEVIAVGHLMAEWEGSTIRQLEAIRRYLPLVSR